MDVSLALEDVTVVVGYVMASITFLTVLLFGIVWIGRRLGLLNDDGRPSWVSDFLRNFR